MCERAVGCVEMTKWHVLHGMTFTASVFVIKSASVVSTSLKSNNRAFSNLNLKQIAYNAMAYKTTY